MSGASTPNLESESWPPNLGIPFESTLQVRVIARIRKEFVSQIMALSDDNLDVVLTGKSRVHYLRKHPEMRACERLLPRVIQTPSEVYRVFAFLSSPTTPSPAAGPLPNSSQHLRFVV